MSLFDKEKELKEFCLDRLKEIADWSPEDFKDMCPHTQLHNDIFNSDYYIVGRYQASQWLGADTFQCIGEIKEWEECHLGECHTDFSEPERVVNMYVYVVGERIIQECYEDVRENYLDDQLSLIEEAQ